MSHFSSNRQCPTCVMGQSARDLELRVTLRNMKRLIAKAQAVAEPILARWDSEAATHTKPSSGVDMHL